MSDEAPVKVNTQLLTHPLVAPPRLPISLFCRVPIIGQWSFDIAHLSFD